MRRDALYEPEAKDFAQQKPESATDITLT